MGNVQAPDFSWCSLSEQWEVLVSILVYEKYQNSHNGVGMPSVQGVAL
jgi:hypothetical protein